MDILFKRRKLQKACNSKQGRLRAFGKQRARLVGRRLDDLLAATDLEVMRKLSGRCHELKGGRAGRLSLDLDGPYRLIFEPAQDPPPQTEDGGLDWNRVTAIRILTVEDTHE